MALDYATQNFGHHNSMLDGMARPHETWHQDTYAPMEAAYYPRDLPEKQQRRLPSMAAIISNATQAHVPSSSRDSYTTKRGYYSDYATPSPIQQTPPQVSFVHNETHSLSRRQDVRLSPAHSSTASDRSSDEMQELIRMRQFATTDHARAHDPRSYHTQRSRRNTLQSEPGFSDMHVGRLPPGYVESSSRHSQLPLHQPRSPPTPHQSASPRQETKSMSISNLLTDTPSSGKTTPAQVAASVVTTQSPTSEYRIQVRQQPYAARSCGFGERDRRVIDPPPIVQLTIEDSELSQEEISRRIRHPFSVVHCSIWDESGTRDMSSMPEDFRQQRRLMGTLVASPFVGLDENGEEGCFFCFPDLSCRTPGIFRLKFVFVILNPTTLRPGTKSHILATAVSEVFQVFNAKDFPGMKASTPLTKRLKEQGCLISIKKGNDKVGDKHGHDDSADEDDYEGDDGGGQKPKSKGRKRQKKT